MDSIQERLTKLREERQAREKARINKLRELNLKKYNTDTRKDTNTPDKKIPINKPPQIQTISSHPKNNFHFKGTTKRPISAPSTSQPKSSIQNKIDTKVTKTISGPGPSQLKYSTKNKIDIKVTNKEQEKGDNAKNFESKLKKPMDKNVATVKPQPKTNGAKSVSVFERLYKPKLSQITHSHDVHKKVMHPNISKRQTMHDTKPIKIENKLPVRRSISAIHMKAIPKNELRNCYHSWVSVDEKLNKSHLKLINEDETVHVSAMKSDKKRVTFMTPARNYNSPTRDELQTRLKAWLQKRGKAIDSYHHLQCFGLCHLPPKSKFDEKLDDENKENIALESDSDNDSYNENMNKEPASMKWRSASIVSESVDFNESQTTMTTCSEGNDFDELVIGALNNLTELLKEGFEWEQCASWLRAIRERFPSAVKTAAYWECRATLEETRGNLPGSVECWEQAIATGTEHSVADASLDQLLDKFMQLKISPNSGKTSRNQENPKLVEVKNVFKSTIIRFAVQQAKLRQSGQFSEEVVPQYCVTPVRRSARLRHSRTPLQLVTSMHHAKQLVPGPVHFQPNPSLKDSP